MATESSARYRRILITRLRFIGDIVLTTPVIRSVRAACPDAYIAYMGEAGAVRLLEGNPFLDEIIPYHDGRPGAFEQVRAGILLRHRRFDLAVDLFGNPRSAILTRLSGARVRVGPDRRGRGRLYTIRIVDDGVKRTAVEFHNRYIAAAGIPPVATTPELFLSPEEKRDAAAYLRWACMEGKAPDPARPLIGIHPGATWPAKKWLPERFAELADALRANLRAQVIITAGPRDAEAVSALMARAVSAPAALKVLPLRQLAAVISCCSAFVSNDAGPMHIAAALGVPTIGLFGPGEESIWFPYAAAAGHAALRRDVPCHPCHLDVCTREGEGFMECMKLLSVADVLAAVSRALSR
ncbi:MAG TPA: glycosyltransferase family 9 protein [Bacteroidota bacterium]|nr:glycosyltransferase family 9 protein [Bacteroidota bacterium]